MTPVETNLIRIRRGNRLLGAMLGFVLLSLASPLAAQECTPEEMVPAPGVQALSPGQPSGVAPTVTIEVRVPAESPLGEPVQYSLFVRNRSSAPAHHVLVKATLSRSARVIKSAPAAEQTSPEGAPPEKATVLAWKLGTLGAGERRELTFSASPTGGEEISCCTRVQFEHGLCVRTRIGKPAMPPPPPAVPRTASEPPVAPLPKGPPPAPPVVDPPSRTPPLTDLAPVGRPATAPAENKPPPLAPAALRVRVLAPAAMALHEMIDYKFEVSNTGQSRAVKVILEVTPGADLQCNSSTPRASGNNPLTWDLGDIEAGATRTVACKMISFKTGQMTTRAVARAAEKLREEKDHAIVIGEAKLAVSLSGPSRRAVGRDATYHITVRNVGEVPAAGVEVTDEPIADAKLVDEVTRVRASNGGRIEANVVRWNLGTIAPRGEQTVAVVLRSRRPGKFTYVCTARTKLDHREQGKAVTEFVQAAGPDVELDRTSAGANVKVGGEVAYALRARNAGTKPDTNLDVVLTIPDGLELIDLRTAATSTRPAGPKIHLPMITRLDPGRDMVAHVRFRALKPGPFKINVQAVSDTTGPDRAIRFDEPVDVEK